MSELRRAWRDVGGARFLSTPTLIAFLAWTITSILYTDVLVPGQPVLPWLVVGAGSSCAVMVALWCVGRVVHRRNPDGPGPWAAAAIYVTAGALRGVLVWNAAQALGLSSSVVLESRIANSAAWSLVVMGCTSIVTTRREQHRALMVGLASRRRELLALQSSLAERIDQTRRDLVNRVHDELGPTLAQLQDELEAVAHGSDTGVDRAVEQFRTAVERVVRPLSRSLASFPKQRADVSEVPPAAPPPRIVERLSVSDVVAPAPSAGLVVLLLALLALAIAPENYRTADAPLRVLVFVALLWLGLTVVRWAARRARSRPTVAVLFTCLTTVYVALAVLVGLLTRAATSGLDAQTTTFPALAVTLAAVAPLAVSLAIALQRLARGAELRSAETVAQLDVLTAALRRELWQERRRLAFTVHGPIQSALVSAAVAMSRPGFTAEQVPALTATLDEALAHIDRSTGPPLAVRSAARELAALWTDSARVAFAIDNTVADAIDADEALRAAVIEVLREAVSNAVRHGSSDNVTIVISQPVREIVRIVVTDDGDGPPSKTTPGLGSVMFDSVALGWALTRSDLLTSLEVELAISAASDRSSRT